MIIFKFFGIKFKISFLFLSLIAWMFLFDKDSIFLIYFFSTIAHEISHILFLKLFDVKIREISFTAFGFVIKKEKEVAILQEILILMSGCVANFALILIFLFFKKNIVVIINLLILVFNMLPFEKLDGGEILNIVLENFLNFKLSFFICKVMSMLTIFILIFLSLFLILKLKDSHLIIFLAEREGFEPPVLIYSTHEFQSCAFSHLGHLPIKS